MVATTNAFSLSTAQDRVAALHAIVQCFSEQISALRLYPGAALAIYRRGQLILDVVEGHADTQRGVQLSPDSLFCLFSGTKPFAAVALWKQIERGRIDLDEPVAEHWTEFGQEGKNRVLVRHILSHRGGFPTTPPV